jgi:hypothetical protein
MRALMSLGLSMLLMATNADAKDNEKSVGSPNGNADINRAVREAKREVQDYKKSPTEENFDQAIEATLNISERALALEEQGKTIHGSGWAQRQEHLLRELAR